MSLEATLINVPFSFVVNNQVLPAGAYQIARLTQSRCALETVSADDRQSLSLEAIGTTQGPGAPSEGYLLARLKGPKRRLRYNWSWGKSASR